MEWSFGDPSTWTYHPVKTSQQASNFKVVQDDAFKHQAPTGGRSITIFQTKATSDGLPDIASFKAYIGGPTLKGCNWLCLEHAEILNGFGATLHCLGIQCCNLVNTSTIGNSAAQYGGSAGGMPGTFIVPFSAGALATSDIGIWEARYEKQKCVPISYFNDDNLQITLFNEAGAKLTWDGSTSCYILLQFKAY